MKIAICCLNSKYIHASLAPWCLAAGIEKFSKTRHSVAVIESTINDNLSSFAQKIIETSPDLITFSCYIWNINQTIVVCKQIKESLPESIIVLGGPEVAYRPKDVLNQWEFIDYILGGEGEFSFPPLCDALESQSDLSELYDLSYRTNHNILCTRQGVYNETPPSPYSSDFFKQINGRICYIESSRGCPFHCAFCLSGKCSKLRFFDLEYTKNDILRLANCGTRTIKFVDRTFNAVQSHASAILNFVKENYGEAIPKGICFHFEIAGDILSEEMMCLLSQMPRGAVQLEIGMQSFNEKTLKLIHRETNSNKLLSNIKRLIAFNNMHIHIDLIAGLPEEDLKSFKNSFNIGYSLRAHMLQMGFLKLLHGAEMRDNPDEFPCNFNQDPPYEVVCTPWLSEQEIKKLKFCEDALERLYNSGRFLETVDYLIRVCDTTPFDLIFEIGNAFQESIGDLKEYSERLFHLFSNRCDKEILKEKIILDLFCSGASQQVPACVKTHHPKYKLIKRKFAQMGSYKVAILPYSDQVLVVEQNSVKDFFGRMKAKIYKLSEIIEKS